MYSKFMLHLFYEVKAMEIIGIICEYSPFHNGHVYHIQKIKELYPDSLLILCLNGYFLERGHVSLLSKEDKVKISLEYGVDVVIELPLIYGTQSADKFAFASTYLLDAMGVNKLIFGSESMDLRHLENLAQAQLNQDFHILSQKNKSYPENLSLSLEEEKQIPSNDLLAISYIKSILQNQFCISYEAIKRTNNFHDVKSNDPIISASNIRMKLQNGEDITPYLPAQSKRSIQRINEDTLFALLKYRILTDSDLTKYIDVKEGLEFKLKKELIRSNSYLELQQNLKSKRYTNNRIQRMLCHLLLGLTKSDADTPITYLRILGFSRKGEQYLKENRTKMKLPTKIDSKSKVYHYEMVASQIYDILTHSNTYLFERKNQPIIIGSKESNQK